MYRGRFDVLLGGEKVSKIEEILRERWHAKEIVVSKFKDGWRITFLTEDRKKIFTLFGIIERYGGEVVEYRINKVDPLPEVLDAKVINTKGGD